jgi:hypothetical protein
MNYSCNKNYTSQYAYIAKDKYIYIDDYKSKYLNSKCELKCLDGHELIYVNGEKIKSYFKHKNIGDTNNKCLSQWHNEWQSNFPKREVRFTKISEEQIKDRRADVILENCNYILEFQHSMIEEEEVNARCNDYRLNNKEIIWIVDGNEGIKVKKLEHANRIYLEFENDWRYKSFMKYENIFIDIGGLIYQISPNKIKSKMIDVNMPRTKEYMIECLKNNKDIWMKDESPQCKLLIKQQGAGNGKTYGIIQSLEMDEFLHYKYIIFITKQHSAKQIIKEELLNQIKSGDLKNITLVKNPKEVNKKYVITYFNKLSGMEHNIVIGTIDSLMYTLGDKEHKDLNYFEGIVNSIITNTTSVTENINYGGVHIKLNKEMCLVGDEMQDLPGYYGSALLRIMRDRYIDLLIVGDKVQSITYEKNVFTYFLDNIEGFSNIEKKAYPFSNICRRFYNKSLVNFVNHMIPFDKYDLPHVQPYKNVENENGSCICILEGEKIYGENKTSDDTIKLNKAISDIMSEYKKEVDTNNYQPNDFLIVVPFTQRNPLANGLELAINMYWKAKYNEDIFKKYAIFHRSEMGTSINLDESRESTRIVSIHTSKGDGRNVVFVLDVDEANLKRFSKETNNLIYDSLLHVAITRMKKKLYFRLVNNGDDICTKIQNYIQRNNLEHKNPFEPTINISKKIKYDKIVELIKSDNNKFKEIKENIIDGSIYENIEINKDENTKKLIDMCHHNIRYSAMATNLWIEIIKFQKDKTNIINQIKEVIKNIIVAEVKSRDKWEEYFNDLNYNKEIKNNNCKREKNKKKENSIITIVKISEQGRDYIDYHNIIYNFIVNIKNKLINFLDRYDMTLCPYESIIFNYVYEIINNNIFTDITITNLYDITDMYSKCYDETYIGHENCLCKNYFKKKTSNETNNICKLKEYLTSHYEQIEKLRKMYNDFFIKNPNINWNIEHLIYYCGNDDKIEINKRFRIIGYDDINVFNIYLKPQFSSLNYNDTLIDSIFDNYLIKNIKSVSSEDVDDNDKKTKDYKKFYGKNMETIIFSADFENPYQFALDKIDNNIKNKIEILKKIFCDKIVEKYEIESISVFNLYIFHIRDKTEHPVRILDKFIEIYEKKIETTKIRAPEFILYFFKHIKDDLKKIKNKEELIKKFEEYKDKKIFLNELKEYIIETINKFLGYETEYEF